MCKLIVEIVVEIVEVKFQEKRLRSFIQSIKMQLPLLVFWGQVQGL